MLCVRLHSLKCGFVETHCGVPIISLFTLLGSVLCHLLLFCSFSFLNFLWVWMLWETALGFIRNAVSHSSVTPPPLCPAMTACFRALHPGQSSLGQLFSCVYTYFSLVLVLVFPGTEWESVGGTLWGGTLWKPAYSVIKSVIKCYLFQWCSHFLH